VVNLRGLRWVEEFRALRQILLKVSIRDAEKVIRESRPFRGVLGWAVSPSLDLKHTTVNLPQIRSEKYMCGRLYHTCECEAVMATD